MKKLSAAILSASASLPAAIPDCLIIAGAGSVSYGAWLVYPAAGFIVGGVLALAFGIKSASQATQ